MTKPVVNIIPFEWYHFAAMELREQEKNYFDLFPDFMERVKMQAKRGPCFTAICEGEGIASCWGFAQMWPGVFEVWLLTSTLIEKSFEHKRCMVLTSISAIADAAIGLQAHRFQMTINPRFSYSERFAKALKFEQEGVLKAYGPDGSDFLLYARIFDERFIRREARHISASGNATATARSPEEAAGKA